jgi:hypothetical protein
MERTEIKIFLLHRLMEEIQKGNLLLAGHHFQFLSKRLSRLKAQSKNNNNSNWGIL